MTTFAVISYHRGYERAGRPDFVAAALGIAYGSENVRLISSNFNHIRKVHDDSGNDEAISVRAYQKNISLRRVLSYWDFARGIDVSRLFKDVDVVYICVPDYLSAVKVLLGRPRSAVKVIVDVVDLWPEAIPVEGLKAWVVKNRLILRIAAFVRRKVLGRADLLLFQSQHFREVFGSIPAFTGYLPMCQEGNAVHITVHRSPLRDGINVLFLGSLNSITDVDGLSKILIKLAEHRHVSLSIIGGGEGVNHLLSILDPSDVVVSNMGLVFDSDIISSEISRCHFGFNGYREATEVSVSYKVIDYLANGLPVINCTKGELRELIPGFACGLCYTAETIDACVERILHLDDSSHIEMSVAARRLFVDHFGFESFCERLRQHVDALMIGSAHHRDTVS